MRTLQSIFLLVLLSSTQRTNAQTDLEAYNIVQEILITMDEAKNPIKIKTQSSTVTQTAKATKDANGERVILYNLNFLNDFNRSGGAKQRAYLIMAHEVSHHLNNDDFTTDKATQRQDMEKKADEFAGRLLYRLCIDPKDIAAVFKSLPPDPSGSVYLPVAQRTKTVMDGYSSEKKDWERVGRDPCLGEKMDPPISLQRRYSRNKAEGVTARVFHDSIVFKYNVFPLNESTFKGRFAVSDKARLAPKISNFIWFDDPGKFGTEKKAVWYYKKDGFLYPEVFNGDLFGLTIFPSKQVPEPSRKWRWWVGGFLAVSGAVLLATGIPDRIEAQKSYKQYKNVTNPNLYTSITGTTRQQAFAQFNPQKKTSEWRIGIGIPCFVLGTLILLDANHKRRNFPKDIFLFEGIAR